MANGEQSEPAAAPRAEAPVLPLAEAAARLGISTDALRMRIRRGKARAFKDGRSVFVYLDGAGPAAGPTAPASEHRPNRPAGPPRPAPRRAAPGGDPWSLLVDTQKQETIRLVGEVERLNRRLDRQADEARDLREMLQREQVLRQQEQSLRHALQDMLERLVERPALAGPAPPGEPDDGARIIVRAAAPRGAQTAPAAPVARPPAPDAGTESAAPTAGQDRAADPPAAAPPPAGSPDVPPNDPPNDPTNVPTNVPPGAEDLADMLKEIGQSLRDLDRPAPAGDRDPEDERRAAARVMSRLFRSRTPPRPTDS